MRHPCHSIHFYGQIKVQQSLLKMMAQNSLPHALIFSGTKGIGKATCAYHLACSLLTNDPSMLSHKPLSNPVNKRIIAGSQTDLFVLEAVVTDKFKKNVITVDQVRQLIAFTNKTSWQGGWRIIIIDSLDEMNHQALNALLKRLEEPPQKCLFILIHHYHGLIPATIFSRCQPLTFTPLDTSDLANVLRDQNIALNDDNIESMTSIAGGSADQAWRYIKYKGDYMNDQLQHVIAQLADGDWQPCMTFINNMIAPVKDTNPHDKLLLMGHLLCFNLTQVLQTHYQPHSSVSTGLYSLLKTRPHHMIIDAWQNIQNLFRDLDALHLDSLQVAISAFNSIYQLFMPVTSLQPAQDRA